MLKVDCGHLHCVYKSGAGWLYKTAKPAPGESMAANPVARGRARRCARCTGNIKKPSPLPLQVAPIWRPVCAPNKSPGATSDSRSLKLHRWRWVRKHKLIM